MTNLIGYLLESSLILAVLYTLYLLLLRKETFFNLNRCFLLAIPILSFLIPLVSFDVLSSAGTVIEKPVEELNDVRLLYYDAFEAWSANTVNSTSTLEHNDILAPVKVNYHSLLIATAFFLYGIGLAVVVLRLIGLYVWIHRVKCRGEREVIDGVSVVKLQHPIAPFSFLNSVFVPQDVVRSDDFEQILTHEKVHIRERHSIDLLLVQLSAAILWFNPVIWQLIKSLKTTHEYIADKKTIDQGHSLVAYQTLLLRQLVSTNSSGLIHNFNLSFTKKRITMMNVKKSGWIGQAKAVLTLLTVTAFSLVMVQCNSKVDEQMLLDNEISTAATLETTEGVDVPVISDTHFELNSHTPTVDITVDENIVKVNNKVVELDELASVLEKESEEGVVMILTIDRTQPMSLVREVQREMRRANQLKVLYLGQTQDGKRAEVRMMLPPLPENHSGVGVPIVDDEYAKENNLNLLKVSMRGNTALANQQKAYDFVKNQVAQHKTNYVVSARFSDENTYDEYLANVYHLQLAFYQLYDEKTRAMYGESIWDVFEKAQTSEKYAKMYSALKKEAPMAISIAED